MADQVKIVPPCPLPTPPTWGYCATGMTPQLQTDSHHAGLNRLDNFLGSELELDDPREQNSDAIRGSQWAAVLD